MPTEARTVRINSIPYGEDSAMCVIKALLIVALHTGQIEGDIRTVLDYWFGTPARTIRWKYGKRPVIHRTFIWLDRLKQAEGLNVSGSVYQLNTGICRLAT